jgi:hypothetical protein
VKIEVLNRQSLLDIALQTGGGIEIVFPLAVKNGIGITDEIPAGTLLETAGVSNALAANHYEASRICPATDITAEDVERCPYGGINYMGIEIDYTVS